MYEQGDTHVLHCGLESVTLRRLQEEQPKDIKCNTVWTLDFVCGFFGSFVLGFYSKSDCFIVETQMKPLEFDEQITQRFRTIFIFAVEYHML